MFKNKIASASKKSAIIAYYSTHFSYLLLPRDALAYSAKRGLAIACCHLSVRLSITLVDQDYIGWKSWKLIARTTNLRSLRSPKAIHLLPWQHGEILREIRGGVGKSGVLKHKSGNISETRKDRAKDTTES